MSVLKIKISNNGSPNKAAQENALKPEKVRIEKYRADRRRCPIEFFYRGFWIFHMDLNVRNPKYNAAIKVS